MTYSCNWLCLAVSFLPFPVRRLFYEPGRTRSSPPIWQWSRAGEHFRSLFSARSDSCCSPAPLRKWDHAHSPFETGSFSGSLLRLQSINSPTLFVLRARQRQCPFCDASSLKSPRSRRGGGREVGRQAGRQAGIGAKAARIVHALPICRVLP